MGDWCVIKEPPCTEVDSVGSQHSLSPAGEEESPVGGAGGWAADSCSYREEWKPVLLVVTAKMDWRSGIFFF